MEVHFVAAGDIQLMFSTIIIGAITITTSHHHNHLVHFYICKDMQIITSSTIIDVTSTSIVISSTNIISVAILRQISFSTPNIQLHRHHISFITDRKKNCCSAVNKADPKLSSNIKYCTSTFTQIYSRFPQF